MSGLPKVNPLLGSLDKDFLYHIGYDKDDCKEKFKDVKFVVTGGSWDRMKSFAEFIAQETGHQKEKLTKTDRFVFFKIGPVLSISHGMGVPSLTIMLHETIKLLHYAGAKDAIIIRIGTSGGIDIDPGTVVITNRAFNAFLEEQHEIVVFRKKKSRPAIMDQEVAQAIFSCQDDTSFKTVLGGTLCTDDFYEEQGRTDGAVCEHSENEKEDYLKLLKDKGIANIEMECTAIASLCHHTNVKCAIVCVTLVNRLKGDQVDIKQDKDRWVLRPQQLVAKFIKTELAKAGNN